MRNVRDLLGAWSRGHERAIGSRLAYERIELEIETSPRSRAWMINVVARLHATGQAATGPLLLNFGYCPLVVEEISSTRAAAIEQVSNSAGVPVTVLIPAEQVPEPWAGTDLTYRLRWLPDSGISTSPDQIACGPIAPCLVLPSMLPRLVSGTHPLAVASQKLPRLFYKKELPADLDAGGIAMPDRQGAATPELLQTVVFPRNNELCDGATVAVGSSRPLDVSQDGAATAHARMEEMAKFIAQEFNCVPPVRFVGWLEERSHPEVYAATGAYCPVPALAVGGIDPRVGQDLTVIRLLAQSWLDGGVQIVGENAATLVLAIAGALGLRWLEANDRWDHLQTTINRQRSAVQTARANKRWTESEIVYDIQLSLFDRLRKKKVMRKAGELFCEHWGEGLPQTAVVDALRREGVRVPHVFE